MINLAAALDLTDAQTDEFLQAIQGNILKSHGRSHTAHFILRFNPNMADAARAWLADFARTRVTSAAEQSRQTANRRQARERGESIEEKLFAMVLLSAAGYRALGYADSDLPYDPSDKFAEGMATSSLVLNDPEKTDWEEPYNSEVHAMILLAHENAEALHDLVGSLKADLWDHLFCDTVHVELGKKRVANIHGVERVVEHFGYVDGISQPLVIKQDIEKEIAERGGDHWNPGAHLGLVMIEEQPGSQTYGSYMVYRKLEQNVRRFMERFGSDRRAGNQAVGRQTDGTPLIETAPRGNALPNDFNYDADPDGTRCAFHAHIRKSNPRGEDNTLDNRIVRRGISYDHRSDRQRAEPGLPAKGLGLLFISFQTNLGSFEQLQFQANDPDFIKPGTGKDIILGSDLVTLKGGEYFFAPSLPFLENLATLTTAQQARFNQTFQKLLEDRAALRKLQPEWQRAEKPGGSIWDRIQAVEKVGILKKDFFTLYAHLTPYLGPIRYRGYSMQNRRNRLTHGQQQAMRQAFDALLDPEKLNSFMAIWNSEGPLEALQSVGNFDSEDDIIAFYEYLNSEDVRVPFPLWA